MRKFAIFGSDPAFAEPLFVGKPNIGNRQELIKSFEDILDRRWLTNNGAYVQEFERRVAEYVGVEHCIAVCNATIGLEIALRAMGLSGEVIVPSFTFIATAHSLQWQGITPIFCDIDPKTHNIDPRRLEELVTPRTTGIIGVHLWGRACDTQALEEFASSRGLRIIYDAAHAFGCSDGPRMIGGLGDAEVFSFHATKFMNSFEGGMIATNNSKLAERIRLMKNFGFAGFDNVVSVGTNGKMSEISAAMGLVSLDSLEEFVSVNSSNYEQYRAGLSGIPGVRLITYDERDRSNYQYIVLEIDEVKCGLSRDQLVGILHAENVIARRYFYPGCHRMEPYKSMGSAVAPGDLSQTELLSERVLVLPTGTGVSHTDIGTICDVIRNAVEFNEFVTSRLANV